MNKAIYLLIAVSFATTAFFVQPAQAQVSTGELNGVVCVGPAGPYVTYAEEGSWCGEGLPGAEVRIQSAVAGVPAVDRTETTDDRGGFSFQDVPEGDYTLTVTRQGFVSYEAEVTAPGDLDIITLEGEDVTVSGSLLTADGQPVDAAYISYWGSHSSGETKVDAGQFNLDVRAGWYHMEVEAPGQGFSQTRQLLDGSDLTIQLDPVPETTAIVRGQIVDQDGEPVVGADVISEQWEVRGPGGGYQYGDYRNMTQTDANGEYELGVYAGGLNLRFQKEGHAPVFQWLEVASGAEEVVDVELLRYPEKTAKIQGQVTGVDGGLRHVTISLYHPQYGLHECSIEGDRDAGHSEPSSGASVSEDRATIAPYPYYQQECSIRIDSDGRFEDMVTPGYATLNVHHNHWMTCSETTNADGSYVRSCGRQYHSHVQTLSLEADATTTLDITLKARPAPDAIISGYVVDSESGKAIPRVHVSFSNEETYGWGSATTDGDGSYKVKLHGGLQRIHVWAEGYLPWQGMVDLKRGAERPFDIFLTPGQEAGWGGCCYAYSEDMAYAEATPRAAPAMGASGGDAMTAEAQEQARAGGDDSFEDLRGGLGPYDAAKRAQLMEADQDAPGPFALLLVGLVAIAALRKRG